METLNYFPIEYIFNLLNICRKRSCKTLRALRLLMEKRELRSLENVSSKNLFLIPRLSFWIKLCQTASLLNEETIPYPTMLVEDWLSWSTFDQIAFLLDAWSRVPGSIKFLNIRSELLNRLQLDYDLGVNHKQELIGLQAIGVCRGENLTDLGNALLNYLSRKNYEEPLYYGLERISAQPWIIEKDEVRVPFPPEWILLWKLEKYLDPEKTGVYHINKSVLRLAVQRDPELSYLNFIDILTKGLKHYPPETLMRMASLVPTIRIIPGPILEFSDIGELKMLRQTPALRKDLDQMLSPRHVALDPERAPTLLLKLLRRGLVSEWQLTDNYFEKSSFEGSNCNYTKSDCAYLYSLILFSNKLQNVIVPPPGLIAKLTSNIDYSLRAAAARKAKKAQRQVIPDPVWNSENEAPKDPSNEIFQYLQKAISRETPIDVLYKGSKNREFEKRHLTPLLLEQRGQCFYLIAYCHTRRANRTFRLDRLKLTGKE